MRIPRLSRVARWNLVGVGVVLALMVALWPRNAPPGRPGSAPVPAQGVAVSSPPAADQPAAAVTDAALPPCPSGAGPASGGPLRGVNMACLADGRAVDVGASLAGRPVVLNLWAWWCGPCAKELPVLQDFAHRAGPAVTVLTVHSDPDARKAVQALQDYGVRLPTITDPGQRVAALTGAPAAYPVTVLLRPDGTVARVLPVPFTSVTEITDAVDTWLGMRL